MMRKTLLVLVVLAGVLLAATVVKTPVFFSTTGARQKRMTGTAACTTQAVSIGTTPYVSLFYNAYVTANVSDSTRFAVWYQWASDSNHFPVERDTVAILNVGNIEDSLRSEARRWGNEFYPPVSQFVRFIFVGLTANSDSCYIDSVYLVGQTIN